MKPLRLYIDNFMCYNKAFIDFTQFSTALIIGKTEANSQESNGVGKTSIFKAIEYVFFNHFDNPLDRIIRDDSNICKVVMDFSVGDQEYRLARTRTKKGSTDLVLLERTAQDGSDEEVYHSSENEPWIEDKHTKKYWKNISGSRAGDTEKDLEKLIKINHKAFRSTFFFPQNNMGGLPTVTPEKRKQILKEAFGLAVYTKLEKMAKEKAGTISKELDRTKLLIESIGNPYQDLVKLSNQLSDIDLILNSKSDELIGLNDELSLHNEKIQELTTTHANLEAKFTSLLSTEKSLTTEKNRLEISVKEYTSKKSNIIKAAKEIIEEINNLKEDQAKLALLDYSQIDILTELVASKKEEVMTHNLNIRDNISKSEELKVPLPQGRVCKECRKPISDQDRQEHKDHVDKQLAIYQKSIQDSRKALVSLNADITANLQTINSLNLSKQQLENLNTKITIKNKEIQDKNETHDEYIALLSKFTAELKTKIEELEEVKNELKNSSLEEANLLKNQIDEEKKHITSLNTKINALNKEINHFNSNKAVVQHSIEQKTKDNLKKSELKKSLQELEEEFAMYPLVLQAFSSVGIPNLIIQNMLDDLQVEANNLLTQLRPGLQLSFFVEKTVEKTGDQADTLDINYHINGKPRYYEQLSGAMQLAVVFSLKLGLAFLLQKMFGTDIKLLLLDEVDQSLDPIRVDAYAEIVKFFQKDFTILVITHNDRLKDKFSHAILVEQDMNMVSNAKVVSSW